MPADCGRVQVNGGCGGDAAKENTARNLHTLGIEPMPGFGLKPGVLASKLPADCGPRHVNGGCGGDAAEENIARDLHTLRIERISGLGLKTGASATELPADNGRVQVNGGCGSDAAEEKAARDLRTLGVQAGQVTAVQGQGFKPGLTRLNRVGEPTVDQQGGGAGAGETQVKRAGDMGT